MPASRRDGAARGCGARRAEIAGRLGDGEMYARTHARTHAQTYAHTHHHSSHLHTPLCGARDTDDTRVRQTDERAFAHACALAPHMCPVRLPPPQQQPQLSGVRERHTHTHARTHTRMHARRTRARARTHTHTAARSHDISRDEVCVGTTLVSQALSAGRASPTRAASRSIHLLAQICFSQFG